MSVYQAQIKEKDELIDALLTPNSPERAFMSEADIDERVYQLKMEILQLGIKGASVEDSVESNHYKFVKTMDEDAALISKMVDECQGIDI